MPVLLILLALFGLVFGAWATSSSSSSGRGQAQRIPAAEVPAVTGIYPQDAEQLLRAAGLVPVERWCTAKAPEYVVKRVVPAEGTVVPRGVRVRMYLVPALSSGVKHPLCSTFVAAAPARVATTNSPLLRLPVRGVKCVVYSRAPGAPAKPRRCKPPAKP